MATPAANGNPDSLFINEVRRILRDQPAWFTDSIPTDGTNGITTVAGAKPFRLQRAPIVTAGVVLTAPFPVNSLLNKWTPVYDSLDLPPAMTPIITDGGAGAGLAAGTYQVWFTYVYTGGETGPSPLSNALTVAATHIVHVQATGAQSIPASVIGVNIYLLRTSAAGSADGYYTQATPSTLQTTGQDILAPGGAGFAAALVVPDTGEVIFPVPPPSGTLSATYQTFRYSNTQILDALTEGVKSLWPEIWQEQLDTSLTPAPYLYEYTLPAVFNDPRVQILLVEIRDPNVFIYPYKEVDRYTRSGLTTLFLADLAYSPAGNIRITYNAPYNALSDPEVQVMHLPVYYAVGRLLADQEAFRSRQDELVPLTGEGGSQSGVAQQTSAYWFALYEREKTRFARHLPVQSTKYFRHWSYTR